MLKHPDKFLPVTIHSGLTVEVSTGWNGDFRVKHGEKLYLNPFHEGHRFFRVAVGEVLQKPAEIEEVTSQKRLESLLEAKNSYISLYFE
jgi:hypothetical protein